MHATGNLRESPFPLRLTRYLVLALSALMTLAVCLSFPFPAEFDELQHLSVIAAQHESPHLFPDYEAYRVLEAPDYMKIGEVKNYINHPSLYYLVLSVFYGEGGEASITRLRLINGVIYLVALALLTQAAIHLTALPFSLSADAGKLLVVLLALFPKSAVGGLINNDNFGWLAAGCVFYGLALAQGRRTTFWLATGLILAGWTKLTALIMLGSVLLLWRMARVYEAKNIVFSRQDAWLLVAGIVAFAPYTVNFLHYGGLLWTNNAHFFVPFKMREQMDFSAFIPDFLARFAEKWQADEANLHMGLPCFVAVMFMIWGVSGRFSSLNGIAWAFIGAFFVTFLIHIGFAWEAFMQNGDVTIAQTRYYNVLWPGLALALSLSAEKLHGKLRLRTGYVYAAIFFLLLAPTLPVALLLTLAG